MTLSVHLAPTLEHPSWTKKSGQMEINPSSPWHGNGFLVQSKLPQGPCLGSMVPSHIGSNSRSGRLMGTILVIGLVVSG